MGRVGVSRGCMLSLFAATTGLSACSGADAPGIPTAPGATSALTVRIDGTGQRGFVGQTLTDPIGVQVVDSAAHAVKGQRRIRISVSDGGGSVSDTVVLSDDHGHAAVWWALGQALGTQHLAVSLPDAPSSREQLALAQALGLDAADLVVMSGATSGTIGVLIRQDDGIVPYTLTWPDTVLRLLPRTAQGTWEEVTVFTVGHPPVSVLHPWTDGVDTVRVAFRSPIAVPVTVWIATDFDTTAARARFELAGVDRFWASHMVGLRVGRTRIESAPNLLFTCGGDTRGYFDNTAINVYYIDYSGGPEACDAHIIRMSTRNALAFAPDHELVLAHEMGHAMSLDHIGDQDNVMWPGAVPVGNGLRTGQIYWMHFHYWGSLNTVVGVHPVAERNCNITVIAHCPPQTLAVW